MDQIDLDIDQVESLSEVTFFLVVLGSIILGIEGLSMAAGTELNPLEYDVIYFQQIKTASYLLIGLAALHQAYFGYSSLIQRVRTTVEG